MASPELGVFALSRYADRLSREGSFKQAAVLYSRTLKAKSDSFLYEYDLSQVYKHLASFLYSQRNYKQAMRKYKKAVQINEFLFDCDDRIGFCLINLGEYGQTIEFFQKEISYGTDPPQSYIYIYIYIGL